MNNAVKNLVDKTIEAYDDNIGLIKQYYTPNYHSNLKPGEHYPINTSTKLAAAIFSCSYEKYYSIANSLLRKVISLQCKQGEVSGLWPYFYEESIAEMVAPDWNYADFNAYPMIYILYEHRDKLEDGMFELISQACEYACRAMIRRNLTVIYTNPTVMSAYCLITYGELSGKRDILEGGIHKLKKFYLRIMSRGCYDEYNCPGYSLLIANIYSMMLRHFKDNTALSMVKELNDLVWTMLGEHYHLSLGEFNGPNLRQYGNFIKETSEFQAAVGDELGISSGKEATLLSLVHALQCPEEQKKLFLDKQKNTDFRRLLSTGYIYPYLGWPIVDTQYITPRYTLGSFSMMDCWNQHRNVISYIGSKEKKVCIRLRALHNDYDFASTFLSTAQYKNAAITVANFHTDRGDTHHDLDPVKDATIKAYDLRIRYQIEANVSGVIDDITVEPYDKGCIFNIMGTKVKIEYPYVEMTGENTFIETTVSDKEIFVDAVFYKGEEKDINLNNLASLVTVSYLTVGEVDADNPIVTKDDRFINAEWMVDDNMLSIKSPYKPDEQIPSVLSNEIKINGIDIIKIADEDKE